MFREDSELFHVESLPGFPPQLSEDGDPAAEDHSDPSAIPKRQTDWKYGNVPHYTTCLGRRSFYYRYVKNIKVTFFL